MRGNNLYSHFKLQFESRLDSELLCTASGESFTYRDADSQSSRLASYLVSLGLQPGDRVSVQAAKSPNALFLYLACLRGGFVYHPLNPAYTDEELDFFLSDATPQVVVCDPARRAAIGSLCQAGGIRHLFTLDEQGQGTLVEKLGEDTGSVVACDGDDIAALLYSSGTTGVPKGIMLSHDNLLQNARSLVDAWGFRAEDRLLHALPIFHVHGLFVALGCVLLSGASMRWLDRFDAERVAEFLPECSVMMGVPTYYTRLLGYPGFDKQTCRNMRLFVSGSAPLRVETFVEFEERTGHRILERYGMTETNMNTSNPLRGERKPGTVGPPLPGVEVRVVDDNGNELPEGDIGALQVRGANVFKGYWGLPEKTAEDFTEDGFFDTGDRASIDKDGYVSIVGRAKDLVITGGLNVYPKEVETFLDRLPAVAESAVIGVPHADFGEAVVAVVVPADGIEPKADEIIAAAKGSLAGYKVPKSVVFTRELPRNTMAKVQKNVLRDRYSDLFA